MKNWINRAAALLSGSLEAPRHELNELDWKSSLSPNKRRLSEHLCAFANYSGGGFLVFGIGNDGKLVGIDQTSADEVVATLSNLARDAVEPQVAIDHALETLEGVSLLFVHIAESSVKPVRIRGKSIEESYIRSGGTTRKASRQEIGTLMLNSRTPRWEELHASVLIDDERALEMLNPKPVLRMLQRPVPKQAEEMIDWMSNEKFVTRSQTNGLYVTNLGAITAARTLGEFPDLSRKAARVIVYDGLNKAKVKQEQEGNLGYANGFQGLIDFVSTRLPQSEIIKNALREKTTVYPEIALRELIANALIHQDFAIQGSGPLIEIFDDRIEISNPGQLLPSKRLDRLIGTQPESRNEVLAKAFRRYKICEERGSGLLKAGLEVELYGLPPIRFESGSNYFKVCLYAPRTYAQMSPQERLDACYQHAVLKYYSSSAMTNKSLRERLKMPERQRSMVSVLLQQAVDSDLIKLADPESTSRKFAEYVPVWA